MARKDFGNAIDENVLDPYELAILNSLRQSDASGKVKERAISDSISKVMSGNIVTPSGEFSVADVLVAKTVNDAIMNPTTGKLKDLAAIVGDVAPQKVELTASKVDKELEEMALGDDAKKGSQKE